MYFMYTKQLFSISYGKCMATNDDEFENLPNILVKYRGIISRLR